MEDRLQIAPGLRVSKHDRAQGATIEGRRWSRRCRFGFARALHPRLLRSSSSSSRSSSRRLVGRRGGGRQNRLAETIQDQFARRRLLQKRMAHVVRVNHERTTGR